MKERGVRDVSFWNKLFKQKDSKPKAIAFVDYEHWYYSYKNQFGIKPDVLAWRQQLDENYVVEDIMVFAEFGHHGIGDELSKLRNITNTIIETAQPNGHHKKDMTDFIMLDYIYQTAISRPEMEIYILFTGDGHFHSVVKYLSQRLKKRVIVYGVSGCVSKQLKTVAADCVELPSSQHTTLEYRRMIVRNLDYVSSHPKIIPSFNGTVDAVARWNNVPPELIRAALREMLEEGLVVQKEHRVAFNRFVKVIAADWDALRAAGLWDNED